MKKRVLIILLSMLICLSGYASAGANVIYVVSDMGSVNPDFLSAIDELGLTYETILDSQAAGTNFSQYDIILADNENYDYPRDVPINDHPAILTNRQHLKTWKWSYIVTQAVLPSPYMVINTQPDHPIMNGIDVNEIPVYETGKKIFYLDDDYAYEGLDVVASTIWDNKDAVIATAEAGSVLTRRGKADTIVNADTVFFGIYDSDHWTDYSRLLFKNSLTWITDRDHDGYIGNRDCAPDDPNIPAENEVPYNGIDDDCDPSTLDDPAPIIVGSPYTDPAAPYAGAFVTVYADIDERYPDTVELRYRVNSGDEIVMPMTVSAVVNENVSTWKHDLGIFNEGDHIQYYIYAKDANGQEVTSTTYEFIVSDEVVSFAIILSEGYNLISIPLMLPSTNKDAIFSDIGAVKTYQSGTLVDITSLQNGKGYFVESSSAHTETVYGIMPEGQQNIQLNAGMNLVGIMGSSTKYLSQLPSQVTEVAKRNSDGSYTIATYYPGNGWHNSFDLEPGRGYWMRSSSAAVWQYYP